MKTITYNIVLILLASAFLFNCSEKNENSTVTIGIPSDIETTNPMYAFGMVDGSLSELLYLPLVKHAWNDKTGDLEPQLMLAKKITWNSDFSELDVLLRDDVKWTDGKELTAEDVVFTFDVYSDPETESKFYGLFKNYYLLENQKIDIKKSFEIISPYHLKIKFAPGSTPDLNNLDYPVLPEHIYSNIKRKDLAQKEKELPVVSNGPFKLKTWEKNQFVSLIANENSFLHNPENVNLIVFKVIPNISNRLIQLKKGEIDLVENVRPDNLSTVKSDSKLVIMPVRGRSYDYIGWNEVDPEEYSENNRTKPNRFFSSAKVRKALTHAINREEILNEFLYGYGELAVGPVSPIFKKSVNPVLKPYSYDAELAIKLLREEGWADVDNDGILEKNNVEFSFALNYSPDKPHRKNAAVIIQNNLKAVGIRVNVVSLEKSVFLEKLFSKQFDAWLSGWTVPLPIELSQFWHSSPEVGHLNLASYKNSEADDILEKLQIRADDSYKYELYKKFQEIIHRDEPFTFLFWADNLVVYNSRIKNIDINPLGAIQKCWNWKIDD
ncbi:MAG: ABC transporter substrate-binding protein [Ignavibacteriaceae bacterium]